MEEILDSIMSLLKKSRLSQQIEPNQKQSNPKEEVVDRICAICPHHPKSWDVNRKEIDIIAMLELEESRTICNSNAESKADSLVGQSRKSKNRLFSDRNTKQAQMLAKEHTVWHACSSLSSENDLLNWKITLLIIKLLKAKNIECPALNGKEVGVFGENPLHILLLFNEPTAVENHFKELWNLCGPEVRKGQYKKQPYVGENVIHLAIMQKFPQDFIKWIIDQKEGADLLNQRATGNFFKDPEMSGGYCMMGELPAAFAACAPDLTIFKFFYQRVKLADIKTEKEGHNLLHLLVLCSASKDTSTGESTQGMVELFDRARKQLPDADFQDLMGKHNKEGFTPLTLAAAKGSVELFLRIFDDRLPKVWTYHAVECRKMYLVGVDVPLERELKARLDQTRGKSVVEDADERKKRKTMELMKPGLSEWWWKVIWGNNEVEVLQGSLLETLVLFRRKDILHKSLIHELVEAKWDTYGCEIFYRELLLSIFVAAIVYFLPMTKYHTCNVLWAFWHFAMHCLAVFLTLQMRYSKNSQTLVQKLVFSDTPSEWFCWFKNSGGAGGDAGNGRSGIVVNNGGKESGNSGCDPAENNDNAGGESRSGVGGTVEKSDDSEGGIENKESSSQVAENGGGGESRNSRRDSAENNANGGGCGGAVYDDKGSGLKGFVSWAWMWLESKMDDIFDVDQLFQAVVPPFLFLHTLFYAGRVCYLKLFISNAVVGTCHAQAPQTLPSPVTNMSKAIEEITAACAAAAQAAISSGKDSPKETDWFLFWFNFAEKFLHLVVGLVAFLKVGHMIMGVSVDCGSFILMAVTVALRDLPIFLTVYLLFLFGFAHVHYLVSNNLHAGVFEGMDSVRRIFGALLGDIEKETNMVLESYMVLGLTNTVSIFNYIAVAVVLLNLLIASLNNTYNKIMEEAKEQWKLHRARVLVRMDHCMTDDQRMHRERCFWQKDGAKSDNINQRLMTFNVFIQSTTRGGCCPPL